MKHAAELATFVKNRVQEPSTSAPRSNILYKFSILYRNDQYLIVVKSHLTVCLWLNNQIENHALTDTYTD